MTEFQLDNNGHALIAVYVHDAEPGNAGRGGFLADIILDDGEYISTNENDPRWKCDSGAVIADRDDGWETANFDDSEWMELTYYEQFGEGIWGFGANAMRQHLNEPDCEAFWAWCGPNDAGGRCVLQIYDRDAECGACRALGGQLGGDQTGALDAKWARGRRTRMSSAT